MDNTPSIFIPATSTSIASPFKGGISTCTFSFTHHLFHSCEKFRLLLVLFQFYTLTHFRFLDFYLQAILMSLFNLVLNTLQ